MTTSRTRNPTKASGMAAFFNLPRALLVSMRPYQWSKNLIIFAALLFSQNVFVAPLALRAILACAMFCLLSSAVYVLNDLLDRETDRLHPEKRRRPIASGRLAPGTAALLLLGLAVPVLAFSFTLTSSFGVAAVTYFGVQILYSIWLKHLIILDIFAIASGFVIRAVAGGLVIDVVISSWLLVCTVLLALFLALSKRRCELILLKDAAVRHRATLGQYSVYLLDQMIAVVTSATVISYCLYTMSAETVGKFGTRQLYFTIPFVLYGIFRYLYLTYEHNEGGSPERTLVTDWPLLINVLLFAGTTLAILYG